MDVLHQNCLPSPNYVVFAETVNTFKWHLDKFWSDKDVFTIIKQISMASETAVL